MLKPAVIFDRDGTLIIDKVYLNDPEKIEYLPDVFEALRLLRDLGYDFAIATNQSGLARGIVEFKNLDIIHQRMAFEFAKHGIFFKGFYYAPYSTTSGHFRRKPNPGMLVDAARDHRFDLSKSWMVGDRLTDVNAGISAGTKTVLLSGVETPPFPATSQPDYFANSILDAAKFIASQTKI